MPLLSDEDVFLPTDLLLLLPEAVAFSAWPALCDVRSSPPALSALLTFLTPVPKSRRGVVGHGWGVEDRRRGDPGGWSTSPSSTLFFLQWFLEMGRRGEVGDNGLEEALQNEMAERGREKAGR